MPRTERSGAFLLGPENPPLRDVRLFCGERACPALGCAAAPIHSTRSSRQNPISGFRAASRPGAGQARSPQKARSPLETGQPKNAGKKTPRTSRGVLLPIDQTTINGDDRLHRGRDHEPLLPGRRRGWQRSSLGSSGAGQPEGGCRRRSRRRRPDHG